MTTPLRFGLIGCGNISERYGEMLTGRLVDAELVAVSDVSEAAGRAFAERWGCAFCADADDMPRERGLDVVCVLTDSGSHASVARRAIARAPNVIVEKPMALRLEDADAMIDEAKTRGTRLFIVKQCRFNRPVAAARRAMTEGRFGKLALGGVKVIRARPQEYYDAAAWRGTWSRDGGVLVNQASHHIDLLLWLMGDVRSVCAMTATRLVNIECDDTAVAVLTFESGALGVIEATTAARPRNMDGELRVLGERGLIAIGGDNADRLDAWTLSEQDALPETIRRNPADDPWYAHGEYLKSVVASIRQKENYSVDGESGRKSLELIHAIYASAELGRPVAINEGLRSERLGQASFAR